MPVRDYRHVSTAKLCRNKWQSNSSHVCICKLFYCVHILHDTSFAEMKNLVDGRAPLRPHPSPMNSILSVHGCNKNEHRRFYYFQWVTHVPHTTQLVQFGHSSSLNIHVAVRPSASNNTRSKSFIAPFKEYSYMYKLKKQKQKQKKKEICYNHVCARDYIFKPKQGMKKKRAPIDFPFSGK